MDKQTSTDRQTDRYINEDKEEGEEEVRGEEERGKENEREKDEEEDQLLTCYPKKKKVTHERLVYSEAMFLLSRTNYVISEATVNIERVEGK